MEPIGCPETSVTNYKSVLLNSPEERESHLRCGGSLKPCRVNFFSVALRPIAGHGLLILEVFWITQNNAPQSIGLLWTSDQLVEETST